METSSWNAFNLKGGGRVKVFLHIPTIKYRSQDILLIPSLKGREKAHSCLLLQVSSEAALLKCVKKDPVCTAYLRGSDVLGRCKIATAYRQEKCLLE